MKLSTVIATVALAIVGFSGLAIISASATSLQVVYSGSTGWHSNGLPKAIASGLIALPAAGSALAGTNVSFAVTSAFVTVAGGPGVYVTVTRSHGTITVSAS